MPEEKIIQCPACGEPVQPHWRLCPACETRLRELSCPLCLRPIKENWKRCPECEAQLICGVCGRRIEHPDQGCSVCRAIQKEPTTFQDPVCGLEMVYVADGTFRMGDTFGKGAENESPVRETAVAGFYMARYVVTQAQWSKLMPDNPSPVPGEQLPVVQITWEQAGQFARLLTRAHERRFIFSLPSEAEWEYAARSGGKQELFAGGSDIEQLAWYEDNSQGHLHPVGTRDPNGLGIYDMSGNVWEWCRNLYVDDAYSAGVAAGPAIVADGEPDKPGQPDRDQREADRVIRGGSWHLDAWSARCSRRIGFAADFSGPALGFRLMMRRNI